MGALLRPPILYKNIYQNRFTFGEDIDDHNINIFLDAHRTSFYLKVSLKDRLFL